MAGVINILNYNPNSKAITHAFLHLNFYFICLHFLSLTYNLALLFTLWRIVLFLNGNGYCALSLRFILPEKVVFTCIPYEGSIIPLYYYLNRRVVIPLHYYPNMRAIISLHYYPNGRAIILFIFYILVTFTSLKTIHHLAPNS